MINKIIKISNIMILFITFVFSCSSEKTIVNIDLTLALQLSGNNRPELEKVLSHYSKEPKDSLKLKAAEFLISNMIYHRSLCGEYIENHIKIVDSLYNDMPLSYRAMLYTVPSEVDSLQSVIETELDIENISADFLIENIECSFYAWENAVYSPKISFEDFCEYILPYKFNNEPLVMWKDSCLDIIERCRDLGWYELSLNAVNSYYFKGNSAYYYTANDRRFENRKFNAIVKSIENTKYEDLTFNRSFGIPTAIDFIPYNKSVNANNSFWSTTINNKYLNSNLNQGNRELSAKVFRKTYSINETPNDDNNFVPAFLQDPHNKDVTYMYQNVSTVEYDFGDVSPDVKYAYLGVFHDGQLCEVAWSTLIKGKASFQNMGHDVIYLPIYYQGKDRVCAKNPILVNRNGGVEEIGVASKESQTIKIERISYYNISGEYDKRSLIGGKIAASNNLESLKFDTLATITHSEYQRYDTINTNSNKKYKYWLFLPASYNCISELHFYDKNGNSHSGISFEIDRQRKISKQNRKVDFIFDKNILTFWYINSAVGVEFAQPVSIYTVKYMGKNDGNGIIPNHDYELFYFNNGEWISLAKKTATDYEIEFENVPVGALLWVHDYGKKCNERPFTIVNGRIKFW